MKRNINHPSVAVKLSIDAYFEAAKQFNKKQEDNFLEIQKETKVKTVKSLLLKEEHHKVFYTLINYYKEKIDNLSQFMNGSLNIMTYINPKASMYVKTGRLATHLGRANNTIRARLRRLEKAGILQVVFHGNKKPLEIIFNKHLCLIYDKSNLEYIPETKFLTLSSSIFLDGIGIKANNKKALYINTKYNNTITQRGVLHDENSSKIDSSEPMQYKYIHTKKTKTTKKTDTTLAGIKERKKVPQKKERSLSEIINQKLEKARKRRELEKMSAEEKAKYYEEIRNKEKLEKAKILAKKRKDAIIGFSLQFFGYLVESLFADKYLAPEYRKKTLNYIAKHFFAKARSIEAMKCLWHNNYKKRIDIAKDYIDKFERPDGTAFDTTYFFPLAFLDIERRGKGIFSFANTENFLNQGKQWEKMNGYNRRTDDDGRHKLNKIAREFENGFIDYNTALQKVKSITNDTDEYVKQLNARVFGIYSSMQKV